MSEKIVLVIDFGSQYTQLIARRVREHNVYSEILPHSISVHEIKKKNIAAIILSGGPSSVYDENSVVFDEQILNLDVPILGICYGLHLMIYHSGGLVIHKNQGEYGQSKINQENNCILLNDLSSDSEVWMSHGDEIENLGNYYNCIARSTNNVIAAVEHKERPLYGVQFHPEVIHTIQGHIIISNFLFKISNCKPNWTAENFILSAINKIRKEVGSNGKVITGLSGGVDSSVVATLLHKAIGKRSSCVFIDHGLLREGEVDEVMGSLKDGLGLNIYKYNYTKEFLSSLSGIIDPEQKRKIIGTQFIRSFEIAAENHGDVTFLAQGTLYPDIIESGGSASGPSVTIKSHHNVGGIPKDMNFKLIEPIKMLFKDEARQVGKELGLPNFIIDRHPFPGPGLAVRILGPVNQKYINILREADKIFIDILHDTNEYENIWQAFAVLIPIKTVGVMGDSRTYENLIALRAVTSVDGMTADSYKISHDILDRCSSEIINNVKGVNRVVYDITSKPPGTIEWE